MRAPSSTPLGIALRAQRPALQRCLGWLVATPVVAVLCLTAAPEARAVSFSSPEPNPFLLADWVVSGAGASKSLIDATGASFFSEAAENASTYTFTSELTDQPYRIFFNYSFIPDDETGTDDPTAAYQICSIIANCTSPINTDLGESGFRFFYLTSNQALRFSITNSPTQGGAELRITNFNATPVPSPLPVAGLGLAALGIYRARRKSATLK